MMRCTPGTAWGKTCKGLPITTVVGHKRDAKGGCYAKLRNQKMRCTHCNQSFMHDDTVELHHADGNHFNWNPRNLKAMHRECHQHQEVHKDRIKDGKVRKSSLTGVKLGSRVSVDTARF